MLSNTLALFSLVTLSTAHFTLDWPTARGFDDDKEGMFPCGGFDSVKTPRTKWPISGGPVQVKQHHSQTNVKILLAIGDKPGNNFNITLRPTFSQEGLGDFCAGALNIPSDLNITEGTPATIQVVTNSEDGGGLYQCADVILTKATLSESDYSSHCKNNSGSKITKENIGGNPNVTEEAGASPTTGGTAPSSSPSGLASHQTVATWLMGAVGVVGLSLL